MLGHLPSILQEGKNKKMVLRLLMEKVRFSSYFCGRLAGGIIPFIRKYSTIWP